MYNHTLSKVAAVIGDKSVQLVRYISNELQETANFRDCVCCVHENTRDGNSTVTVVSASIYHIHVQTQFTHVYYFVY